MRLISHIALGISGILSFFSRATNYVLRKWDSLVVVILNPGEILELGKGVYKKLVPDFSSHTLISQGLSKWEKDAIESYPPKGKEVIILAGGGGREAIACAKMGFNVVSIDALDDMTKMGQENASREKVNVIFKTSDILQELPVSSGIFDLCLLSQVMYSTIPAPEMRVALLKEIHRSLKAGGIAFIHFLFDGTKKKEPLFKFRRFVAYMCNGNKNYKPGDEFISALHFMRHFTDDAEIADEMKAAGFLIEALKDDWSDSKYAVLRKP